MDEERKYAGKSDPECLPASISRASVGIPLAADCNVNRGIGVMLCFIRTSPAFPTVQVHPPLPLLLPSSAMVNQRELIADISY